VTVIRTLAEAERRSFPGSPAFLLGGRDAFIEQAGPPSVSCRLYTDGVTLSGLPNEAALAHAIAAARTVGEGA